MTHPVSLIFPPSALPLLPSLLPSPPPSQPPSISAIILAGGQSSRMGRDKALLPVQGVPLLRRVYEAAQQCTPAIYVVTSWPERYQPLLPTTCQFIQELPLPGATQPQGPLVGFAQGLAQVKTDWALLLACDLPRLQASVLQTWLDRVSTAPETAIACLPWHSQGWEPLCGFYRRSCLTSLTSYIQQGGRSFQGWLAQHPVYKLPVENPQVLLNCNTPQDINSLEI
jgi:molybdenum cofactor guanylyltransferase